ncbi:MAG: CNNM domain-containing protein [Halorientalis sp.]
MTPLELALRLVAGLALILANGFFVAIEFALTRARQYSEAEFVGGDPALERAWSMTDDLEIYLTTCQVGITASSIAVGVVAEPALAALFEPYFAATPLASVGAGAILAFGLINLLHLTHGEQTPTYLGVERSRTVCRYGAAPLHWFSALVSPVITVGDAVAKWTLGLFGVEMTGAWLETEADVLESRADLRNRLDSLLARGELPAERREEVMSALDADAVAISEIMVPAGDIVAVRVGDPVEENLERVRNAPHTRFPVVGEDLTDFRGIVYAPSIIENYEGLTEGTVSFEEIAAPPMTLAADTSVSDAFDQFQAEDQEIALVLRDGAVVGLLTATDALETVMGNLEDPLD